MTPLLPQPAPTTPSSPSVRWTALVVAVALALALGLIPVRPSAQQAYAAPSVSTCTSTPFRTDVAKRVVYRIPATVVTTKGTVLAFAERRRSTGSASDLSDTEVVIARSTDRGCHWSSPRVIADHGADTVGNPAPVVDAASGTILLFTVDRAPGSTTDELHLQRSVDDGVTFTAYSKAGNAVIGVPRSPGGLTGPGHALQLRSPQSPHPGRIIVPVSYRKGDLSGSYAIYSDDHGRTWRTGYDDLGRDGRIEGTLAELLDGRVWVSYRNRDGQTPVGRGRVSAFSSDGGASLDTPLGTAGLPTISVQGSSLALTGTYAGTLLLSSPARKDVRTRHQMALFSSRGPSVGQKWSAGYDVQLDSRPASYSDLTQLDDTTVGLLYETGKSSWTERIDWRVLKIADVLGRTQVASKTSITAPSPLSAGRALNPTVQVTISGSSSPAGEFTVRLRGKGVDRTQKLVLYGDSNGRRLAKFGALKKGAYTLEVRYSGTSRIKASTTTKSITAR